MSNEIKGGDTSQVFKYNQLDKSTADFLRTKESNMREIVGKAYTELGKELYEAQQELAGNNHYDGVFERWYTYLGWKKRTVYNLIDRYLLVQKLHDKEKETLEDLPVSLTYDIAKPSAESTPEKAQAKAEVLAGEITTGKAYKERIKQLEKERDIERKERERLEQENEELSNNMAEEFDEIKKENETLKRKYGEEGARVIDDKERVEFYQEFANDLDYVMKKYGSIIFDGEDLKRFGNTDVEYAEKVNEFNDFWKKYVRTVMSEQTIINMEEI